MTSTGAVPEWQIEAFKLYEAGMTPTAIAMQMGMPTRKVSRFIVRRKAALASYAST